ncbi:YceI family protein [Segetibacter aerophilus]|uniref:Polyisoprenoid-binding protein n=1 Tax=Segetibacter aerophilus TaxID=670293 RepID=A0A512BHU6_9BACT|nr:YceI family protein [Segetibacter aerophilus]GEO11397.1 polyisoprenoid-binding protein [Segetibacter aerophilus]
MKKFFTASLAIAALVVATSAFTPSKNLDAAKDEFFVSLPGEAGKWVIDKSHSNVKFSVTHLVVSEVEGNFKMFDGNMENAKNDFSDAKINFTVDVNSINTENEMRDKHLKSDDFFNAEKFPAMKFQSTSFTPAGGNKYKLAGNLTIRDVTKPVVFDVTFGGTALNMGKTKAGFKAKTTINRFDYNLKWDKATEAGGLVVSKDVELVVNVEMNKA